MSSTFTESIRTETAAYGGLVDAVGGIATVVLAIIALAGIREDVLMPIAVIVFGAALLIQGGAMLSEFAQVSLPVSFANSEQFGAGNLSTMFLVGAAGIVLGVLALVGIAAAELIAVSVIAFGAALLLSSNSVRHLYMVRSTAMRSTDLNDGTQLLAGEMASGSAGVQLVAGLAAIVLGILAVTGAHAEVLIPSALIVLGATVVLSGSTLSGIVLGFMQPEPRVRARTLP